MAVVNTNLQLVISICTSANGKQLIISEATGVYHQQSNPGGWKTPESATNPSTTAVTNRGLVITSPSGVVKTYTNAQLTGTFPDDTGNNVLYVDNSAFGGSASDNLPDGTYEAVYTIDGTINGGVDTYTEEAAGRFFSTSNDLQCCLDKLFAAAGTCDGCRDEKLNLALEVDAYIKAAEAATNNCLNGNAKAEKFRQKALWICNTHNCSNCS